MHYFSTLAIRLATLVMISAGLAACGGGGGGGGTPSNDVPDQSSNTLCGLNPATINWDSLLSTNEAKLSSYRLFQNPCNPTTAPNGNGVAYDLTTALFTDYASKYRFIFIPEGKAASYREQEVLDFPVGTVISKTFSLPGDTRQRGFEHEKLIETRLLIRRESGWVALPYVWNDTHTDAELKVAGKQFPASIVHNGETLNFTYSVPDTNKCKQCHQLQNAAGVAVFSPIGPKARLLNREFDYEHGRANQLQAMANAGMLTGLPADLQAITTAPDFHDGMDLSTLSQEQLQATAKGYLDVNCSHCHRPEGGASNTGLYLEYWRDFVTHPQAHGLCKRPVAYGGGALSYDLVAGDAAASIIHFRMNSREPGDKMPEVGRDLIHQEGVALIAAWINSMPNEPCNATE